MLAVLVSLDDPGLMIFPTHRVFEHEPDERLPAEELTGDAREALDDVPARPRSRRALPGRRHVRAGG